MACGSETDVCCDQCGTPLCGQECCDCEVHDAVCSMLVEDELVGVSLDAVEVDNIFQEGHEVKLEGNDLVLYPKNNAFPDKLKLDNASGVTEAQRAAIKNLMNTGKPQPIRVFFIEHYRLFPATKRTDIRHLFQRVKGALRTSPAEVFVNERGLYEPGIVIIGDKDDLARAHGIFGDSFRRGINYISRSGKSVALANAALTLLKKRKGARDARLEKQKRGAK